MSCVHRRGPAEVNANFTSMIDVTFLLIVFFVLVSRFTEVENVDLRLPELGDPRAEMPGDEQRTVINVVPGSGGTAREYRVGGKSLPADEGGIEALTAHLALLFRANPVARINLRADRDAHYDAVQPVLEAVSAAASRAGRAAAEGAAPVKPRVNLVILREE